jgi:hypothetical protein
MTPDLLELGMPWIAFWRGRARPQSDLWCALQWLGAPSTARDVAYLLSANFAPSESEIEAVATRMYADSTVTIVQQHPRGNTPATWGPLERYGGGVQFVECLSYEQWRHAGADF